ncbi:Release factor glutamine methyltransferase [compost metagenome]
MVVAQRNAEALGVVDRVRFLGADAGDADKVMQSFKDVTGQGSIDILVSNPPYIAEGDPMVEENVKKYEPHSALYAADDGRAFLKKWSSAYCPYLNPLAICLMEMGMSQGPAMKEHFQGLGVFNEVRVIKDLSGHDRIICGEKNG